MSTLQCQPDMEARINIVEQPHPDINKFRYKSQGPCKSGLSGASSDKKKRTLPSVKIVNNQGEAKVVVELVADENGEKLHPCSLVGENCRDGICIVDCQKNKTQYFRGLNIQHVKKEEKYTNLLERHRRLQGRLSIINNAVDQFTLTPLRDVELKRIEEQAETVDLSVVRLKFTAFLRDADGFFNIPLEPVISSPVKDSQMDLRICRISRSSGSVSGGDEVFLFCDKVKRDDIQVWFFQDNNKGNILWQAKGDFGALDVHRQFAIAFKTPAYGIQTIAQHVRVKLQLRRPSDGKVSDPVEFTYTPSCSDCDVVAAKKRKITPNFKEHIPKDPHPCFFVLPPPNFINDTSEVQKKSLLHKDSRAQGGPIDPSQLLGQNIKGNCKAKPCFQRGVKASPPYEQLGNCSTNQSLPSLQSMHWHGQDNVQGSQIGSSQVQAPRRLQQTTDQPQIHSFQPQLLGNTIHPQSAQSHETLSSVSQPQATQQMQRPLYHGQSNIRQMSQQDASKVNQRVQHRHTSGLLQSQGIPSELQSSPVALSRASAMSLESLNEASQPQASPSQSQLYLKNALVDSSQRMDAPCSQFVQGTQAPFTQQSQSMQTPQSQQQVLTLSQQTTQYCQIASQQGTHNSVTQASLPRSFNCSVGQEQAPSSSFDFQAANSSNRQSDSGPNGILQTTKEQSETLFPDFSNAMVDTFADWLIPTSPLLNGSADNFLNPGHSNTRSPDDPPNDEDFLNVFADYNFEMETDGPSTGKCNHSDNDDVDLASGYPVDHDEELESPKSKDNSAVIQGLSVSSGSYRTDDIVADSAPVQETMLSIRRKSANIESGLRDLSLGKGKQMDNSDDFRKSATMSNMPSASEETTPIKQAHTDTSSTEDSKQNNPLHVSADLALCTALSSNSFYETPFHSAVIENRIDLLLSLLSQMTANCSEMLNAANYQRQTALHIAALTDNVEAVSNLVKAGADPLVVDKNGNHSIHVASRHGNADILAWLLNSKLIEDRDFDTRNNKGLGCCHLAAKAKDNGVECILLLKQHNFNVHLPDSCRGKTALHIAAMDNNVAFAECLIFQCDANIEETTYDGYTPLHFAASYIRCEIATMLLACGADPEASSSYDEDDNSFTPRDLVYSRQMRKILNEAKTSSTFNRPFNRSFNPDLLGKFCKLLNQEKNGSGWLHLAETLHFTAFIDELRVDNNPSDKLLRHFVESQGSIKMFRSSLMNIGRHDALQVFNRALTN